MKLERMCQQERNKAVEFKNDLQQQIESLRAEVDKKQNLKRRFTETKREIGSRAICC